MNKFKVNKPILAIESESDSEGEEKWCICRSTDGSRFMIACDKCEDWFHGDCVNITPQVAEKILKYYCPNCKRNDGSLKIQYENKIKKVVKEKKINKEPLEKPVQSFTSNKERDRPISSSLSNKPRLDDKIVKQYRVDKEPKSSGCGVCLSCNRKVDCQMCNNCRNKTGMCMQRICSRLNKSEKPSSYNVTHNSQYRKQLTKLPQAFEPQRLPNPVHNIKKPHNKPSHLSPNVTSENLVHLLKRHREHKLNPNYSDDNNDRSDESYGNESYQHRSQVQNHSNINRQPPIKKIKTENSFVPHLPPPAPLPPPPPQQQQQQPRQPSNLANLTIKKYKPPQTLTDFPIRNIQNNISEDDYVDENMNIRKPSDQPLQVPREKYANVKKEITKLSRKVNNNRYSNVNMKQNDYISSEDEDDNNFSDVNEDSDDSDIEDNADYESTDNTGFTPPVQVKRHKMIHHRKKEYQHNDDDDDEEEEEDDLISNSYSETDDSNDSNFELNPRNNRKSTNQKMSSNKSTKKIKIECDVPPQRMISNRKKMPKNKSDLSLSETSASQTTTNTVAVDESPISPVEFKPKECKNTNCKNNSVLGSAYCSEKCGLELATMRILTILPSRIQNWNSQPSIAQKNDQRQLSQIREEIQTISYNLQLLERNRNLEIYRTNESRQLNQHSAIINDDSNDSNVTSADDVNNSIECVTCGMLVTCTKAMTHMENCFQKVESATMVFADQEEYQLGNGSKLFCDYLDPQVQGYCKRLAALCDHYKDPKEDPETICAFPYDNTKKRNICLNLKNKCLMHVNWERISRAVIDIQRYRFLMRLEDLQNEAHKLQSCVEKRGTVMNLLLNETIDHQPNKPIIAPKPKIRKRCEKMTDPAWI